MPAPYSKDLRIRVIDAYSSNEYTIEQVSETFKVSIKTIKRWAELKEKTGDLNAKVGYQKGHSHAIKDLDEFKEIVISGSFSTVKDILEVVKVGTVHSIGRALKKINFTKKKHRTTYKEQKEQQVTEYKKVIEDLDINKFVYLDETGVEQRMMQGCSWMQRGLIKIEKVFGVRTARTNIIAAKTSNGIEAAFIFDGACNSEVFEKYVSDVLCPVLQLGQVVIMDNASFHKAPIIRDLIEKEGCQLIYLPPYSPELNPIEKYWSVLKKYIKKVNCIFTDMWECIEYAILCTDTFGLPKCD